MIPFVGTIISGIASLGSQWMKNKAEKAQAKHEREVQVIKGEQKWDEIQAENAGNSWKDEYLTIILTSPFVAMFLAAVFGDEEMMDRIERGFDALDQRVPEEYWVLLAVVVAASFGVKSIVNGIKKLRGVK